jgi:hypothetical protein
MAKLLFALSAAAVKHQIPDCALADASQFSSRCSVPKEQLKIARHFNAGKGLEKSSPAGTAN